MMEKGWNSNSTLRNSAQFEIVLGNHWERNKLRTIDTLKVDKLGDNVGIAIINHPFLMVFTTNKTGDEWGVVYYCYTNISMLAQVRKDVTL